MFLMLLSSCARETARTYVDFAFTGKCWHYTSHQGLIHLHELRRRAYALQVTLNEVGRYAESLPQVKRKGTESRPGWYVHDRLVVRLHDRNTLVIRVPLSKRESLLETYPESFGVPPRMEAHNKVEAYLDRAKPVAVRTAIDLAWEMQRS